MKMLFDQNLSPRLTTLLADLYPASLHVRDVGLESAEDVVVW
jgi:predicted nuclease of predicted toxin-antitoxin system